MSGDESRISIKSAVFYHFSLGLITSTIKSLSSYAPLINNSIKTAAMTLSRSVDRSRMGCVSKLLLVCMYEKRFAAELNQTVGGAKIIR